MKDFLALVLIGLSVGLGNFAASIAIGLGGASRETRIKMAVIFGLFETGMPIVGLLIGQHIAGKLGGHANLIGGGLLALTGFYIIIESLRKVDEHEVEKAQSGNFAKLLLSGLALSIDNLIVGFGLGTRHQPIAEAVVVIGVVSILLALAGLEIGNRASSKLEEYSELASGAILLVVGVAIGAKLLG